MNEDIILKADNLFFSYDNEKTHSLNGLSLEIKRGHKIAFMGANGSGKSTFFSAVMVSINPPQVLSILMGNRLIILAKGFLNCEAKSALYFRTLTISCFLQVFIRKYLLVF